MLSKSLSDYFQIKTKKDIIQLLEVSGIIAVITFYLAMFSDFSVKMYYGTPSLPLPSTLEDGFLWIVGVVIRSSCALLMMVGVILVLLLFIPKLRVNLQKMFGII